MTALDDALAASSLILGPHQLNVAWRETDNGDLATNPDSLSNFTQHFAGAMTVSHSLDDALPDPVTMTGGNDASGSLTATLNGREGLTLSTRGVRTVDGSCTTTGLSQVAFSGSIPTAAGRGDYLVCAVVVSDSTASITQASPDPKNAWDFLGTVTDSTMAMYVYGTRRYYPGRAPISFTSNKPVDFICTTIALWAANPQGVPLDYRLASATVVLETSGSATTSHSNSTSLNNRGVVVSFWGGLAASGTWTPSGALGSQTSIASLVLHQGATSLVDAGLTTVTATSSVATNVATFAAIGLEPYERPRMDGRQFFSPLRTDSPVYGFDRDTAGVNASIRVQTIGGPVDTQIFSGQMQGLPVSNRQATLNAVSRTRIRMNRSLAIPVVGAFREGLTVDWFVTWLMASGSQFVGPAPNRYTRLWAPMYGSVHAHWTTDASYAAAYYVTSDDPLAVYGRKYPAYVLGPFNLGMDAQQTSTRTNTVLLVARNLWSLTDSPFPHVTESGGPILADFVSQTNSKGRLNFYLRADPAQNAPSYLDSGDNFLFEFFFIVVDRYGGYVGYIHWWMDPSTRQVKLDMGSDAHSSTTFTFSGALPTDGSWKFVGLYWDFAAGAAYCNMNGSISTSSIWATNGNNGIDQLAPDDVQAAERGDTLRCTFEFHVPVSDLMLHAGEAYSAGMWADQYVASGALTSPGQSATMRPTRQGLVALAEPTTLNAWETLAALARSTLSAYRVNESDNIEFLPLSYFGETAQATPVAVQDTRTNTGDPDVDIDPSRSRNVVTVQFNDTRIDSNPQPVLLWNTSVEIPAGTSYITFPLDVPTVELHGAANQSGSNYQIVNLTSTQINTPAIPNMQHYVTILQKPDGTGVVYSEVQVSASFYAVDAQSVTLQFVNRLGRSVYLSNAATQVPFLQILGYGVTATDGYSTTRDATQVSLRGERGLDAEMNWIQDRIAAQNIAANLLGIVAQPRAEQTIRVMGDPRRKPGQLVTILDPEGTGSTGDWRIWSVTHNANGPEYTQDLQVVQVFPTAVWDGADGWDEAVWS